jgi:hypothetical protein
MADNRDNDDVKEIEIESKGSGVRRGLLVLFKSGMIILLFADHADPVH